jgi:hypothetical protein
MANASRSLFMSHHGPRRLFRRQVALPHDHGSWVFLLSPLIIGVVAGSRLTVATPFVILGALAAFLLRQPASILVKVYDGWRSRAELPVACFWLAVYGAVGLFSAAALIALGFAGLLYLAAPAIPIFVWHLFLVSRRAERRQMGVELAGSGVLALAAPAAMWAGLGQPDPHGWWLWGLVWFQSAASIVYIYLRLEQRGLLVAPRLAARLHLGRCALAYTTFNLLAVSVLSFARVTPAWLFLPYIVQWLECLWGTLRPAIGARPTDIGLRQLVVSSLFTCLFVLAWSS